MNGLIATLAQRCGPSQWAAPFAARLKFQQEPVAFLDSIAPADSPKLAQRGQDLQGGQWLARLIAGAQAKAMQLADHGVAGDAAELLGDLGGRLAFLPTGDGGFDPLRGPGGDVFCCGAHAALRRMRAVIVRP